ncbi:MAG: hypothetical protein EKK43_14580 [Methylobacterium sp.]|nr:MAG: hypothetical protein EKK43_14580 [Methylobacterium sp.]RUP16990.1 MAG: hypothetical protein EKK44_31430 [Methylobacterium sp.]
MRSRISGRCCRNCVRRAGGPGACLRRGHSPPLELRPGAADGDLPPRSRRGQQETRLPCRGVAIAGPVGRACRPASSVRAGPPLPASDSGAELVFPLVVSIIGEHTVTDPDYRARLEDVRAWEGHNGPMPAGAFVAPRTDWSRRWPSQEGMLNRHVAGMCHFPAGAATFLPTCMRNETSPLPGMTPPIPTRT